jgi:hypothetical protein
MLGTIPWPHVSRECAPTLGGQACGARLASYGLEGPSRVRRRAWPRGGGGRGEELGGLLPQLVREVDDHGVGEVRRGGGGSAGRWTIILRARWLPGRSPGAGRTLSGGASPAGVGAGLGAGSRARGWRGRGAGACGEAAGVLLGGAQGGVGVGAVHAAGREVVDEGAGGVVVRAGPGVGGDADLGEDARLDEGQPSLAFFAAWAMKGRHGPEAERVLKRAMELTDRLPARALRQQQRTDIMGVLDGRLAEKLKEKVMEAKRSTDPRWVREMRHELFGAEAAAAVAKDRPKFVAEGKREALLMFLEGRGLSITRPQRAAILACDDLAKLDRWIAASGTAASVAELLTPAPKKNGARTGTAKHRAARAA